MLNDFTRRNFRKIHEINQRYATPKLKMSKTVRVCLTLLRCYLLGIVALLLYKFITVITA